MLFFFSVLGVLAVIMLSLFVQIDNWQRDWTTNFAKLDPAAEDPDLRPAILTDRPADVSQRLQQWAQAESQWAVVSVQESADRSVQLHLTRTTPVLRFTDDIQVELRPTPDGGTRVTAESQSRIGKGDLGQNPRNLKALRRACGT